jgi:predicted ATPase
MTSTSSPTSPKINIRKDHKQPLKTIVLTGGPGAGKTAIIELARRKFTDQMAFIPEAASVIFGGGFWRHATLASQKGCQRAIYYVQREFERIVMEEEQFSLALCDRGTLDGTAYWPGKADEFFLDLGTTKEKEYSRYHAVIHLRTPPIDQGYNHQNPLRIETAQQAAAIDQRIQSIWADHPRITIIESTDDFLDKVNQTLQLIQKELPSS